MTTINGGPTALKFKELEEDMSDTLATFFNLLRQTATDIMFGNGTEDPIQVGYGLNGPTLIVSVPSSLRAAITPQTFTYNAKRRGSDSTVNISLVHVD